MKRAILFLVLFAVVSVADAQSYGEGMRMLPPDSTHSIVLPDTAHLFRISDSSYTLDRPFALRNPLLTLPTKKEYTIDEFRKNFNPRKYVVHDYLLKWDTGRLWGDNRQETMPAIGTFATASLLGQQRIGENLNFVGALSLNKYAGLYNNATLGGMLTYELTSQMSASAFGMWHSPSFMSTYKLYGQGQFGGFLTLKTENRKWGIDMGVRNEFNPYTGRFDATPIVMPYYNLQGQKLGFDFGGLIKSMIINRQMQKAMQNGMPPMGPMGPMMPPHP